MRELTGGGEREPATTAAQGRQRPTGRAAGSQPDRAGNVPDASDTPEADVRFIQPYQAVRTYLCPGCNREIPPGLGHMVVVPPDAPDLRRHWHRGCWINRATRY